jgi:hypothetical protein
MRLPFAVAFVMILLVAAAYGQTSGTRVCSTTTSGSISHEYCTFSPLVVQVTPPVVNVTPQITVQPAPVVLPKPPPEPVKEKPIKN